MGGALRGSHLKEWGDPTRDTVRSSIVESFSHARVARQTLDDRPRSSVRRGERAAFLTQPRAVEGHALVAPRSRLATGLRTRASRYYSEFAGILQGEIRQRVAGVRMLITIVCAGSHGACWARDPWHHRHR